MRFQSITTEGKTYHHLDGEMIATDGRTELVEDTATGERFARDNQSQDHFNHIEALDAQNLEEQLKIEA